MADLASKYPPLYDVEKDKKNLAEWGNLWDSLKGFVGQFGNQDSYVADGRMGVRSLVNNMNMQGPTQSFVPGLDTFKRSPESWSRQFSENPSNVVDDPDFLLSKIEESRAPQSRVQIDPKNASQDSVSQGGGSSSRVDENGLQGQDLLALIQDYNLGEKKTDLSALAALTDAWTGSNFARSYEAPMSDEERAAIQSKLKNDALSTLSNFESKRAYTQAMEEQQKAKSRENEADRALRLQIAKIQAGGRAEKAEQSSKSRFMKDNQAALRKIAKARYGSDDPNDRSHDAYIGPLNDEIFEFGKFLEDQGGVARGRGYNQALQFMLDKPLGPDGL